MKREIILSGIGFLGMIMLIAGVSAAACTLEPKLVSQDPYPAIPGDYAKLVFQLDGVDNPDCGQVSFELIQKFPISLDPGRDVAFSVDSGKYPRNYPSFVTIPYSVRVDAEALDGDNLIEARISSGAGSNIGYIIKDFNLSVKDTRADFEVSVKDYVASTNTLTFEILNVGKNDVEALTIEIPKQDTIAIKGANRNIVGSLDSNEDTTFSFEAVPKDGDVKITILYTDATGARRSAEKNVSFDSSYFNGRARDVQKSSAWVWIVLVIVVIGIVWWWRRRSVAKKHALHHHVHHDGEH